MLSATAASFEWMQNLTQTSFSGLCQGKRSLRKVKALFLHCSGPLLLWLQGGPGWPSMYGMFKENGPFLLNVDKERCRYFQHVIGRPFLFAVKMHFWLPR